MANVISDETIEYVGILAKLELSDEEKEKAKVTCKDSLILLDNSKLSGYRFKQNYYYVIGDNYINSEDSRNWGLLPEDYIVGKACFIWKSIDVNTGKYRFNRFFKMIE